MKKIYQRIIVLILIHPFFLIDANDFEIQPKKPQLIVIIDDLGDNLRLGNRIANLPVTINLSILPNTPFAKKLANKGFENGHDIMLHAPMEALSRRDLLGKDAIYIEQQQPEVLKVFESNLQTIPHVIGFNNHMGSRLTQSESHMTWLMQYAKKNNLYFVDSRTAKGSVAYKVAQKWGIRSIGRDVFLDSNNNQMSIATQLIKALDLADRYGKVVIIGHPYPSTIRLLERELPFLSKHYQFISLSRFFEQKSEELATQATLTNI